MSDPIRRVIIETEIRSVDGRNSRASTRGGSSSGATGTMGGVATQRSATSESKKQQKSAAIRLATQKELATLSVKEISKLRQIDRLEKKINQRVHERRMMEKDGIRNLKRLAIARKQYDSGGLSSPNKKGGGRAGDVSSGFFNTGIDSLDKANQRGFQAFITVMTARMAGQALKGLAENVGGIGGEGDSFTAQLVRQINLSGSWKQDDIYKFGRRVGGGFLRATGLGGEGDSPYSRLSEDLIAGPMGAFDQYKQAKMLEYRASGMEKEDDLIKEKRDLLQKEMDAIRLRVQADQDYARRIMGERTSSKQAFGLLDKSGQQMAIGVGAKLNAGTPIDQYTREERAFINGPGRSIFPGAADRISENVADAAGYNNLIGGVGYNGTSLNEKQKNAFRDLGRSRGEVGGAKSALEIAVNMPLQIDRINLELENFEEQVFAAIMPVMGERLRELKTAVQEAIDDIEASKKSGGGQSAPKITLEAPRANPQFVAPGVHNPGFGR